MFANLLWLLVVGLIIAFVWNEVARAQGDITQKQKSKDFIDYLKEKERQE